MGDLFSHFSLTNMFKLKIMTMITKRHHISLIINGKEAELFSQEDLNLRINNVMYDPSKITTTTAEYSFTFDLPKTRLNNKIFDNANIFAKKGKFNKNYSCEVYADGQNIFNGTLRLKSITEEEYKCNLVSIKQNNIEDIFGDHKMSELKWLVPFSGIDSINVTNQSMDSDYFFPFVSYGCFQKAAKAKYGDVSVYTSKYDLDKYLLIYQETFPPSIKINTLVQKLFAQFGYNADGDIFSDSVANNIYLSEYLKDKQDPAYNIGGNMGKCTVNFHAKNGESYNEHDWVLTRGIEQTLNYQYDRNTPSTYNFDTVLSYDVWNLPNTTGWYDFGEISSTNPWLFRYNCIVIPSTGLYKVSLYAKVNISGSAYKAGKYQGTDNEMTEVTVNPNNMFGLNTPIEIQIVRNTEDCELIHGYDGSNKTVYPHEAGPEIVNVGASQTANGTTNEWYIPKQSNMMQYDPYVSPNFVCGFSSIGKCYSFMKNYNSWATAEGLVTTQFKSEAYDKIVQSSSGGSISTSSSDYHYQESIGADYDFFSRNSNTMFTARVSGVFYFEKNDIITCKALLRKWADSPNDDGSAKYFQPDTYFFDIDGNFTIEALSPNESYVADTGSSTWNMPTQFDKDLNLGNFLNEEEKISDFINNYISAFNLSVSQEGNTIFFNKQNQNLTEIKIPVELDNRVNILRCESNPVEYPKSMQVNYSIDEEEAGFYNSVPKDKLNDDNWKDYADRGSEKVILNEYDDTATDESVSLNNSYTWYMDFNYFKYDDNGNKISEEVINIPCISKDEWMIDNYKMEESMQNDGKGLKQRWWFRTLADTSKYFIDNVFKKQIYLAIPKNINDNGFELSYNNKPNTLLTRYFNILAMPESNMVNIETYLSPEEYTRLKGGAPIRVDNDIYITCEIKGYDPTGNNTTEIIAMKKM